ncbi:lactonase family protein [Prevotella sp. 10(H)]|uniref:lactonase family protein n=1 Tax=Prevotella sp. 10(H) TaxID=1158294 RepID=UPI00068DE6BA|nr:lactonase family protein [Prevotella sp. 10(H)]
MNDVLHLFAGTYTSGSSKGIYIYRFNLQSGDSEYTSMINVENPSHMVACNSRRYVYAVSENEEKPSFVNAFFFDQNKEKLTLLNRKPTIGEGPCNITTDCFRSRILTANHKGGSINVFDVNTYGPIYEASQVIEFEGKNITAENKEEAHIQCVNFSPDQKYIFATDQGTDKIYRFEVNPNEKDNYIRKSTRKQYNVPEGSGPRHFIFHPCGRFFYLINQLSGAVMAFSYKNGNLEELQIIRADKSDAKGGDIAICPSGHFLYTSNKLEGDGITIFCIDDLTGRLTKVGFQYTGMRPQNLLITPNGKFLLAACRDSEVIEIYKINPNNGTLTHIKKDIYIDQPVCLKFI